MSLRDYYRHLRELEHERTLRRQANIAAASQRDAIIARLTAQTRQNAMRYSNETHTRHARAARVDQYGDPYVYINGYPAGYTVSSYARMLEQKKVRRR
ncbi:MAG: hypothetical protein AAGD92_03240 [Pseudomonadota bacterium]